MKIYNSILAGCFMAIAAIFCGCSPEKQGKLTLFSLTEPSATGVDFVNKLDFMGKFNIYTYRNFYNGGGVGLADINNDGLLDIYFISNMEENRLYLNKGNFVFEDITQSSSTAGTKGWSTGVSMADVNGDGWIDIYVCNSGEIEGDDKRNELFINNGDLTFTESAAQYGLDDPGYSIHGAFFDYDKDNDLDLYLGNNSYKAIGSFDLKKNKRFERDSIGADKLFRNDGDHFTDVSEQAGIYGSIIGFTLGITVGDINLDGWQDMYLSNDFFERDYIYINQKDGTFREELTEHMRSISAASMGADIGDINNDMYPDIFVTDMLPQSDARMKTVTTFENWDTYKENLDNDYYHQFTRNMLHLNNGDGTFSEIGRLAGVQSTDWSWGALIFDMDNDGKKDLFVANGIFQDLTDQDYLQYFTNPEVVKTIVKGKDVDYNKLISAIPSMKIPNFAFQNQDDFHFENMAKNWGLDEPSFSNGSAYGDLDNDGDYDLVVNNVNMPAFVFQNNSNQINHNNAFIRLRLHGLGHNTFAIGAKVIARVNGVSYYIEQMPIRGYQSTIDHNLSLGIGAASVIDSLIIVWPDGRMTLEQSLAVNQTLDFSNETAGEPFTFIKPREYTPLFRDATGKSPIDFVHVENEFIDFKRDKLIYHMISTEGPKMCKGDVNGDGLEDFYIGGAKDSSGALMIQQANGAFKKSNTQLFEMDALSEDTDAVFFDADQDGDLDLYVCSGSIELPNSSSGLIDRLYINNGSGIFSKSDQILPTYNFESTSCVRPYDYDGDGDLDLFIGVRSKPFYYGLPVSGYILNNDGLGKYTDVTPKVAPGLSKLGMITDAAWADIDGDSDDDIIIVGEYMPLTIMVNEDGKFVNKTNDFRLDTTNGWWNTLTIDDLDGDGDIDFVAGNHGLNSVFRGSRSEPVQMYVSDFDLNGSIDQVICTYKSGISYPLVLKHDLVAQLPGLNSKYMNYKKFMYQTIDSIFTPDQLESALILNAYEFRTSLGINNGDGTFTLKALPLEAQLSPVYAISIDDYDKDGLRTLY
ncbi:MAG: VCBS repeat-containing protein [Cyclobacteriaceae bacterium]|nr:VCBS repeat-containing protein [Cyclobacteriaceae bacterium]